MAVLRRVEDILAPGISRWARRHVVGWAVTVHGLSAGMARIYSRTAGMRMFLRRYGLELWIGLGGAVGVALLGWHWRSVVVHLAGVR